jgi:hypothetical protein
MSPWQLSLLDWCQRKSSSLRFILLQMPVTSNLFPITSCKRDRQASRIHRHISSSVALFRLAVNLICLCFLHPCATWTLNMSESESYIMTDSQSASLSWNKAPIWGLQPDFYYCQTFAGDLNGWLIMMLSGCNIPVMPPGVITRLHFSLQNRAFTFLVVRPQKLSTTSMDC